MSNTLFQFGHHAHTHAHAHTDTQEFDVDEESLSSFVLCFVSACSICVCWYKVCNRPQGVMVCKRPESWCYDTHAATHCNTVTRHSGDEWCRVMGDEWCLHSVFMTMNGTTWRFMTQDLTTQASWHKRWHDTRRFITQARLFSQLSSHMSACLVHKDLLDKTFFESSPPCKLHE